MKVCIVGLGRAGRFHLNSINLIPSCEVKYIIDPVIACDIPADIADCSIEVLDHADKALQDPEVSAFIVSPPTQFHFGYIKQALSAGKHVFTEKPLGKTTTEIEECYDLAAANQLCLFLGFQRRYDENFIALKKEISTIGPIRTLKASSRDNPKPSLDYLKISGNIFHDMLIHDLDMLLYLFDGQPPKTIYACGHAYDSDIASLADWDTVQLTIQFENGMICSIDTSRTAPYGYDQRLELFGEHGMAIAENVKNNTVQVYTEQGQQASPINYSFPQRYVAAYENEIADFIASIENGTKKHNISRSECLHAHHMADAAHESIKTGQVINYQNYLNNIHE